MAVSCIGAKWRFLLRLHVDSVIGGDVTARREQEVFFKYAAPLLAKRPNDELIRIGYEVPNFGG
jgi:hypothetical protein